MNVIDAVARQGIRKAAICGRLIVDSVDPKWVFFRLVAVIIGFVRPFDRNSKIIGLFLR